VEPAQHDVVRADKLSSFVGGADMGCVASLTFFKTYRSSPK
jgi:hypothetical protein